MTERPETQRWDDMTEDEKNQYLLWLLEQDIEDFNIGDWIGQDGRPL